MFIFLTLSAITFSQANNDRELLETGGPAKISKPVEDPTEISIVTYNIRWRTGGELKQVADWLHDKHPTIVALQEVDRAKQRTNRTNNARALADQLGMYYAWAAPPLPKLSNWKFHMASVKPILYR
jgi:hypothetical protein